MPFLYQIFCWMPSPASLSTTHLTVMYMLAKKCLPIEASYPDLDMFNPDPDLVAEKQISYVSYPDTGLQNP